MCRQEAISNRSTIASRKIPTRGTVTSKSKCWKPKLLSFPNGHQVLLTSPLVPLMQASKLCGQSMHPAFHIYSGLDWEAHGSNFDGNTPVHMPTNTLDQTFSLDDLDHHPAITALLKVEQWCASQSSKYGFHDLSCALRLCQNPLESWYIISLYSILTEDKRLHLSLELLGVLCRCHDASQPIPVSRVRKDQLFATLVLAKSVSLNHHCRDKAHPGTPAKQPARKSHELKLESWYELDWERPLTI